MVNKLEAAYKLGQLQAMEKVAYNPTYSQADIDAIRRYNKDVASGSGSVSGVLGATAGVGTLGAVGGFKHLDKLDSALHARRLKLEPLELANRYNPSSLLGNKPLRTTSRLRRQISKLENLNRGKVFRSGALKYLKANKGKAALLAAGGYGLGKLLG